MGLKNQGIEMATTQIPVLSKQIYLDIELLEDWKFDQQLEDWAGEVAQAMTDDNSYCFSCFKETAVEFGLQDHWFINLPSECVVRALMVDADSVKKMFDDPFAKDWFNDIKNEAIGCYYTLLDDACEQAKKGEWE